MATHAPIAALSAQSTGRPDGRPDEDVRRRLNRKLDDIEKIADSFEDTFI